MTDEVRQPLLTESSKDSPPHAPPSTPSTDLPFDVLENMSKTLRRMSSGGPSTVRLRLLILVAQKPRMRKELASMLGITQATLAGHLDKVFYVNLVKENRAREIMLNEETILSVIDFLDRNLLALTQDTTNKQVSQPKETTTNV